VALEKSSQRIVVSDADSKLTRWCSTLGFTFQGTQRAIEIFNKCMTELNDAHSEHTVCAVAIFVAGQSPALTNGNAISMDLASSVCTVSKVTVKNTYKELLPKLSSIAQQNI
jgi:transcription initiation factor TFIIIB Brf1 subunit/transcription initiation factor TFIIB